MKTTMTKIDLIKIDEFFINVFAILEKEYVEEILSHDKGILYVTINGDRDTVTYEWWPNLEVAKPRLTTLILEVYNCNYGVISSGKIVCKVFDLKEKREIKTDVVTEVKFD